MSSASGPLDEVTEADRKAEADAFFDDTKVPDAPADDLLEQEKKTVIAHSKKIAVIREALSDTTSEAWDTENDVIGISMEPFDRTPILTMIKTENQQFNKVSMAFSVLCQEIKNLRVQAEQKFYGPLTMFGHNADVSDTKDTKEGKVEEKQEAKESPEQQMGNFLPLLQDLCNFVNRSYGVVRNAVNQLACLYHERQRLYISTFKHVRLDFVFECLGELCRVLITMDAIILDNAEISRSWSMYKKMIKYIRADPDRYGVTQATLRTFEGCLLALDRQILTSHMFEGLLSQDYGLPGGQSSKALVAGNRVLSEQFSTVIKSIFKKLSTGIGESVETYPRDHVVDLFGLYALYRRLFAQSAKPDAKLYKTIWSLQKKVPLVLLYGRAVWCVADFLAKYAPIPNADVDPSVKNIIKTRQQYLQQMDETFQKKTHELYLLMCMWMVRIESELVASTNKANAAAAAIAAEKAEEAAATGGAKAKQAVVANALATAQAVNISNVLNARAKLLINGILLANQIRNLVTISIHMHLLLEMPFKESNVRSLAICAEMLKAIELTYNRRLSMIGENISHMLGQTTFTLKRIFHPIKKKLDKKTKLDDSKLDVLAAVNLALKLLDKSPTRDRQVVLQLAISVAQMKLKQNHIDEIRYQLWKLELLSAWQQRVKRICDCSFLYWVTNLVPAFFNDIFKYPSEVNRLQYLFSAFHDGARLLRTATSRRDVILASYKTEVLTHFEQSIVDPLSREVETDLRLHIHSVVLEQPNLKNTTVKDLSRFLNLKPLNFFDKIIDVKARVTHYLDSMFYNLSSVALHDWRVYAEMRNLASEKYGLNMTEVHLPGSSHYSEALDVLEIMRNIHIFVARYNYNMNTQIFLERAFDQKHLNTINIHHIADSIRTHGTGIMNTTVNFTYQFLCRKFLIFSEFLYDDHIRSRLIKDIRWFKQEKDGLKNIYPYERAEKFNREIRKLGVSDDGQTFVDQFRQQITEIGNAMGYVRMVRSGGLHHCSNAIKFVPDLENMPSFVNSLQDEKADSKDGKEEKKRGEVALETKQSASNLDEVLDDLSKNFAEGTDYFQVLVAIFQGVFKSEEQKHLRNFANIVPPLTLTFVEKMIVQKEKLHKKSGRAEAAFSDDGFALGLAYILKLLDQDAEFDSLHWFDSVRQHIAKKKKEIETVKSTTKKTKGGGAEEDLQHFQLTAKRLAAIQLEFELLFYSFTGARIFFRDVHAEKKEEKKEEVAGGAPAPAPGADSAPAPPPGSDTGPPMMSSDFDAPPMAPPPPPPPM